MIEQTTETLPTTPRSKVKHLQILDAAQSLFLRQGFTRTSMDAIRAEAQVSKPTLYTHFESKEKLFIGVIEHSLEDISAVWDGFASGSSRIGSRSDLHEVLQKFAEAGLTHLLSPRTIRLARTLLAEGSNFPDLGREFRDRVPQRARKLISSVLHSAFEQEILKIEERQISAAVHIFQAQLLSYFLLDGLLVFERSPTKPSSKEIATIVDLFIDMIC